MLTTVAVYATLALLLVWMGFFMLGSLPLMILKHDTPVDARFIRGLFDVYYLAVIALSGLGALAHAYAQRPLTSAALACICALAFASRRVILRGMDHLRATMTPTDTAGIRRFRQLHVAGMLLNVAQLVAVCVALVFAL